MFTKRIVFLISLGFISVGSLTSCQSNATPTLADFPGPGIGVGISDEVCPTVIAKAGQQINWTNQGQHEHIVRAKSVAGESEFDSGTLQPGDSFTVTLPEPDTYTYECSADGSLTGKITVEP
jgi:plastocyanin